MDNIIYMNQESQFLENSGEEIDANFIILCENKTFGGNKGVFDFEILNKRLVDYVESVCFSKPVVLRVENDEDVLSVVRPYTNKGEFTVVLFANTPLLTKKHLADILAFVNRKGLGVCKLKKGYIFRNDYVQNVQDIFSTDIYDLESNDFFEVCSPKDLFEAENVLKQRIRNFYLSKDVDIDPSASVSSDSVCKGFAKISAGARIVKNSFISQNCLICENVVVQNSKIGNNVSIGAGAIVKDSIVKDDCVIEAGSLVVHSIVGEDSKVCAGAKLCDVSLKENCIVGAVSSLCRVDALRDVLFDQGICVSGKFKPVQIDAGTNVSANIVR